MAPGAPAAHGSTVTVPPARVSAFALALLGACGGKTPLGPLDDAGPRAPTDAGVDAGPADGGTDGGPGFAADCPRDLETAPLTPITLEGGWVPAEVALAASEWEVVERPEGSSSTPTGPVPGLVLSWAPDVVGPYVARLSVEADDGRVARCETRVVARAPEGLRVELFWNPPDRSCDAFPELVDCDESDLDLHLLRPGDERWFDIDGDCHYANCEPDDGPLDWFEPGDRGDDPRLDLDDVEGFGPENVNVDRPPAGVYRVGVHGYDTVGETARATVRVFCGARGDDVPAWEARGVEVPAAVGPDKPFWRVADVAVDDLGRCRVEPVTGADRLVGEAQARRQR